MTDHVCDIANAGDTCDLAGVTTVAECDVTGTCTDSVCSNDASIDDCTSDDDCPCTTLDLTVPTEQSSPVC